jgi:hypothetical protein
MEIQNVSEHLKCYNYDSSERPIYEIKAITQNSTWAFYAGQHKLIFLMEGKVQAEVGILEKKEMGKGVFWFISTGQPVKIKAVANALLLVMRFNSRIVFCDCYVLEQLYSEWRQKDETVDERQLHPGVISPSLWHCLRGLYNTTFDGIRCRSFFEIKVKEVCFLLRAYYSKEELYRIFILY